METGPLKALRRKASRSPLRVLFPESADSRVLLAAAAMAENGLAQPLLLGRPPFQSWHQALGKRLGPENWLDPHDQARRLRVVEYIRQARRHRGMTQGQSHVLAMEPLYHACAMVGMGEVDALVVGATYPTADVARAALWCVGPQEEIGTVSGAFLMLESLDHGICFMMADCAVVPDPNVEQLVTIAHTTARNYRRLFERQPAVAFLSFSTRGSADHPAAHKVATATRQLAASEPDWPVVGEVQVDAALIPEIAQSKGVDWGENHRADVLVFPDLASGNIGQKLMERLGPWRAVGPLLQGLRRPVCDLSRGCAALDIYDAAVLVTLTAG